MKKVLCIFGTRPEAIKLAPIIFELNKYKNKFSTKICVTGQHNEMLNPLFKIFNIKKHYDLRVMKNNQKLENLTSILISKISIVLDHFKPDIVIVHGDTTTTFAASLSSFYKKIRVCHIEAGLRTNNFLSPWPEEMNRKFTGMISDLHFSPTKIEKNNLIKEGISKKNIFITGNTVIDSLKIIISKLKKDKKLINRLNKNFNFINKNKKLILITFHRRENFGKGLKNLINFLKTSIKNRNDIQFVYPVHLNPNIYEPVVKSLSKLNNIHIIKPVDYLSFVYLMMKSYIILTDSGGIQEEAPTLKKPLLVMRNTSERLLFSSSGTSMVVGTNEKKLTKITNKLLDDKKFYNSMIFSKNPYGDGKSAKKIIKTLNKFICKQIT